jgi:CBS domain containing-hemolysin-like protein
VLTEEEREADIDTLGGLVMSLTDRVPSRGELVTHPSGVAFEVLDADPRRIKRLRVRNLPMPAGETASD